MTTPTTVCPSCETTFPRPRANSAIRCPKCGERIRSRTTTDEAPPPPKSGRRTSNRRGPLYFGLSLLATLLVGGIVLGIVFWKRQPAAVAVNPDSEPARPAGNPPVAIVVPGEVPPITPATLAADSVEVPLPGIVTDTCVGGSGRYFILHLPAVHTLAVFDVSLAKVVKFLPTPGDDIHFAAGREKLFVVAADTGVVTRYSLASFKKEATLQLPLPNLIRLNGMAMGSASDGPVLLAWRVRGARPGWGSDTIGLFDGATFRQHETGGANLEGMSVSSSCALRASADGKTFVHHEFGNGGTNSRAYVIDGKNCRLLYGPDGRWMVPRLATDDGSLYFTRRELKVAPTRVPASSSAPQRVEVRAPEVSTPLLVLDDIPGPGDERLVPGRLLSDRRYLLVAAAELFVAIPRTSDRLVLRRCPIRAATGDYLYVDSKPPAVVPGQPYRYQIQARSGRGKVRCELTAGPPGATLSETGLFEWAVPANFTSTPSVIASVTDSGGKSIFHTFDMTTQTVVSLPYRDGSAAATPVPEPKATGEVVKPPARIVAVPRAAFEGQEVVRLPDTPDASCLGGGGRFLLLRLPKTKQLAVVDLCAAKLTKLLPLVEGTALIAAGMSHLLIYYPTADVFQRWSLETFEKEATVKNPVGGSPVLLAHGHACDGPLLVCGPKVGNWNYAFLDPVTFADLNVSVSGVSSRAKLGTATQPGDVRASANGRVFGWIQPITVGSETAVVVLQGKVAVGQYAGQGVAAGADSGVYQLSDGNSRQIVPATDGPFQLHVVRDDGFSIRLLAGKPMTLQLPDFGRFTLPEPDRQGQITHGMGAADCVVLNPTADVLALLDDSGQKVLIRRLNLAKRLAEFAPDALVILGRPPRAVPGSVWSFKPTIFSKSGKPAMKVEAGPPGMKLSGEKLTWAVPAGFAEASVPVILTATDGGAVGFHSFMVPVGGK